MALIYSKASKKSIDNAVTKARQLKPRVKVLGFGRFEVAGSKESYIVQFFKNSDGEFTVLCECKANSKAALPCYHAAACSTIYKLQVRNRQAVNGLVERYCGCGAVAVTGEGRCQGCQAAKDKVDLFG